MLHFTKRRMNGFAVKEERISAMAGGLIHVDQALDEDIHVVGRDSMSCHNLSRNGVILDLGSLGEDVGGRVPDGGGSCPDKLGTRCLEAGNERMKIFFILSGIRSTDASRMPRHHPKGPHARDTVNQVSKAAIEVNQIPDTRKAKVMIRNNLNNLRESFRRRINKIGHR